MQVFAEHGADGTGERIGNSKARSGFVLSTRRVGSRVCEIAKGIPDYRVSKRIPFADASSNRSNLCLQSNIKFHRLTCAHARAFPDRFIASRVKNEARVIAEISLRKIAAIVFWKIERLARTRTRSFVSATLFPITAPFIPQDDRNTLEHTFSIAVFTAREIFAIANLRIRVQFV